MVKDIDKYTDMDVNPATNMGTDILKSTDMDMGTDIVISTEQTWAWTPTCTWTLKLGIDIDIDMRKLMLSHVTVSVKRLPSSPSSQE